MIASPPISAVVWLTARPPPSAPPVPVSEPAAGASSEAMTSGCCPGSSPARLPPKSPNLNAYAERFVRSIKGECLNRHDSSLARRRCGTPSVDPWRITTPSGIIKAWVIECSAPSGPPFHHMADRAASPVGAMPSFYHYAAA